MWQNSPYLSDDINNKIAESELLGGVWIRQPEGEAVKDEPYLPVGKSVKVQTKNTLYLVENRADGTYISGNQKYCPTPVKCYIQGSTWGGSMIKLGWIGRGQYLEVTLEEGPHAGKTITTSMIQEVTEL